MRLSSGLRRHRRSLARKMPSHSIEIDRETDILLFICFWCSLVQNSANSEIEKKGGANWVGGGGGGEGADNGAALLITNRTDAI